MRSAAAIICASFAITGVLSFIGLGLIILIREGVCAGIMQAERERAKAAPVPR